MALFFSLLPCLLLTSGVVEAIKDQTWLGPLNAFDAGNSEQHPALSFLITSKKPSAFDIDCSSSGSDDGILKRSMSATEYSNLTGHRITLEAYQTSDCRDTNCEGQTSQRMLYDHDELFTHSSYISRKDRLQTVKIQWSRLVDGMSQAEYRIDKCGVITGSIDNRELTPFTFENASLATFLDGKPIPPLILPTSINETVTDVTLALLSAMKLCSGTQIGMLHVEDSHLLGRKSCQACQRNAAITSAVLTAGCGISFWWDPIALLLCIAAAGATGLGLVGNCYTNRACP